MEHLLEQAPGCATQQKSTESGHEQPCHTSDHQGTVHQTVVPLLLNHAVDRGHRHGDERGIVLYLFTPCPRQMGKQWQRVVHHVLVHVTGRPVSNIDQGFTYLGKERRAIASTYEPAEKTLIGLPGKSLAQRTTDERINIGRCAPGTDRVVRDIHQHPRTGFEPEKIIDHIEHDYLLEPAAEGCQLPGVYRASGANARPAVAAQADDQLQFFVSQQPFASGLTGIDQH